MSRGISIGTEYEECALVVESRDAQFRAKAVSKIKIVSFKPTKINDSLHWSRLLSQEPYQAITQ